jgi:hypothetical protein
MSARTRAAIPLAIVAVVFATHFAGLITSYDSLWSIPTARSIVREGNIDLEEYRPRIEADRSNDYRMETVDGRYYAVFPIGPSLLALPIVLVLDAAGRHVADGKIEKLVASFIIALAAMAMYFVGRLTLGVPRALLLSGVFAYCTPAWSVASRGLWQHGPSMLMLTLALWIMLAGERRPWLIQFASLPLAFAYVVRPTNALSIVALSLVVLLGHRRFFVPYALWSLPVAIPFLLFNLAVYHSWHSWYYSTKRVGHGALLWEALAGNLVSPNRSLFVFSPVLVLAVYGAWLKLRRDRTPLDWALAAVIVLHWLVISSHLPWDGGHTYGNRLFADVVPYFMYFLIPLIAVLPDPRRLRRPVLTLAFVSLVLLSFAIHYRGAYRRIVWNWNTEPTDVGLDSARVWDWRDPQVLRGLFGGGLRPPSDGRHAPDGAFLPASPQDGIAPARPAL